MNSHLHATVDKTRQSTTVNRRKKRRRVVSCELVVIPIRLDQSPGELCWSDGFSINASGTRVGLTVERTEPMPSKSLVMGASLAGRTRRFAALSIHSQQLVDGLLRIDGRVIKDPAEDMLSKYNLTPRIDVASFRFKYGCDEEVLMKWESLGVVHKYLVDRVLVCPKCESIPTWRHACAKCGSARYRRDRLIHHFACAHVDHAAAFQGNGDTLQCSKCLKTHLMPGTDFEYIEGPVTCFDCKSSGGQPILSCMCHRCLERFGVEATAQLNLYGYHVERMALLDFVLTS